MTDEDDGKLNNSPFRLRTMLHQLDLYGAVSSLKNDSLFKKHCVSPPFSKPRLFYHSEPWKAIILNALLRLPGSFFNVHSNHLVSKIEDQDCVIINLSKHRAVFNFRNMNHFNALILTLNKNDLLVFITKTSSICNLSLTQIHSQNITECFIMVSAAVLLWRKSLCYRKKKLFCWSIHQ